MVDTIRVGVGGGGLVRVALAAGHSQPYSPDALVAYLRRAGRPRLSVQAAGLHALPVLPWSVETGLARGLDVVLADGRVLPWAAVRAAWGCRDRRLPPGHPLRRLRRVTPGGDREALADVVYRLLHPDAITDALLDRLADDPYAARAWGWHAAGAAALEPGGHYARLYFANRCDRPAVTRRFLADLVAHWAGRFDPAALDADARARWHGEHT
jgi:hypothetical protein